MKGWFSLLLLLPAGLLPRGAPAQNGKAKDPPPQVAPDRVEPPDRPSLPKEIAAYAVPPVSGKASPDGPALAEWTRSADPGDIVVFTGHSLTALTGKDAGRDAEVLVYGQAGSSSEGPTRAEILRAYEEGMAVRLPPSLPAGGMILLWVRNAKGLSRPAAINRTEAWWLGPDKASRGDTVSLFGRNLTRAVSAAPPPPIPNGAPRTAGASPPAPSAPPKPPAGPPVSWIYLRPAAGGGGVWVKPSAAHPYKVDFALPAGFPNGEYEAWAHNGRGGTWGWSGPLRLTVDDGPPWTGLGVNVRECGAAGNGIADDTAAIQKALRSAQGTALDIQGDRRVTFRDCDLAGGSPSFMGAASQVFLDGCTFNLVADSNSCHETNGSFSSFGRIGGSLTSQSGSYVMPVYFPLYANNRMDTCSMGTVNFLDPGGDSALVLGAISRKNVFVNVAAPVATYGGRGNPRAGLLNVSDRNMTERGLLPARVD